MNESCTPKTREGEADLNELNECKKLATEFLIDKDSETFKKLIGYLIDTHRMGVYYDDDTVIIVTDIKDLDDQKKWKIIVLAFDKESRKLKEKALFDAESYNAVHNYIKQYLYCVLLNVRKACHHLDSRTPLILTKGCIRIKESDNVLFDTHDSAVKEKAADTAAFFREIVTNENIKIVDGEELSKKKSVNNDVNGYIFISKQNADEIAESLGYGDAKNFYKKIESENLIYKTKDNRFSRRVRDSKIREFLGSEQIFGIKKDAYLKAKEDCRNEKEA